MAQTIAEQVAEKMGNNGSRFKAEDGRTLEDLALERSATTERDPAHGTRYTFADGSAIIDAGGGWDLALSPDCWCWDGAGHSEACIEGER
jgi:hypothetical protein